MKTKEDVLKTALDGVTDKWASLENMFASRIDGIWKNGYEHGRKEALGTLSVVECVDKLQRDGWMRDHDEAITKAAFEEGYNKCLSDNDFAYPCASCPQTETIRVGDVVKHIKSGRTFVVTKASNGWIDGFNSHGEQFADKDMSCWKKTGRHFDTVAELLKEMGD